MRGGGGKGVGFKIIWHIKKMQCVKYKNHVVNLKVKVTRGT